MYKCSFTSALDSYQIQFCNVLNNANIVTDNLLIPHRKRSSLNYLWFAKTPKHEINTKWRNICSKLRNNHENSKILRKNNQKSRKITKSMKNWIFKKQEKTCFTDFCFVTWNQCLSSQIIFPMNKIDRSWEHLSKNVFRMFFWLL